MRLLLLPPLPDFPLSHLLRHRISFLPHRCLFARNPSDSLLCNSSCFRPFHCCRLLFYRLLFYRMHAYRFPLYRDSFRLILLCPLPFYRLECFLSFLSLFLCGCPDLSVRCLLCGCPGLSARCLLCCVSPFPTSLFPQKYPLLSLSANPVRNFPFRYLHRNHFPASRLQLRLSAY